MLPVFENIDKGAGFILVNETVERAEDRKESENRK